MIRSLVKFVSIVVLLSLLVSCGGAANAVDNTPVKGSVFLTYEATLGQWNWGVQFENFDKSRVDLSQTYAVFRGETGTYSTEIGAGEYQSTVDEWRVNSEVVQAGHINIDNFDTFAAAKFTASMFVNGKLCQADVPGLFDTGFYIFEFQCAYAQVQLPPGAMIGTPTTTPPASRYPIEIKDGTGYMQLPDGGMWTYSVGSPSEPRDCYYDQSGRLKARLRGFCGNLDHLASMLGDEYDIVYSLCYYAGHDPAAVVEIASTDLNGNPIILEVACASHAKQLSTTAAPPGFLMPKNIYMVPNGTTICPYTYEGGVFLNKLDLSSGYAVRQQPIAWVPNLSNCFPAQMYNDQIRVAYEWQEVGFNFRSIALPIFVVPDTILQQKRFCHGGPQVGQEYHFWSATDLLYTGSYTNGQYLVTGGGENYIDPNITTLPSPVTFPKEHLFLVTAINPNQQCLWRPFATGTEIRPCTVYTVETGGQSYFIDDMDNSCYPFE